jgi:hypothetical protein
MPDFNLREACHVHKNDDGDKFVGIRADANNVSIYFPLGYQLPPITENERELRRDITNLIYVISSFSNHRDKLLSMKRVFASQFVDFPINAYMNIISDYMVRSYYTETEQKFVTSNSGKIDWRKTMRKHQPILQSNGSPIFTKFEVRYITPNDRTLITRVHEYCVYEAFEKLGWLFFQESPRQPQLKLEGNKGMFIRVIRDKMGQTFIDSDRQLFQSMIDMLDYLDEHSPQNHYYFGTENFQTIWERMIDKVFGVKNKKDYFPRAHWRHLRTSGSSTSTDCMALKPDTIMLPADCEKAFVLDAKYYRFGATGNSSHLPPSSDINKQITYGEYVNTNTEFTAEDAVYNAFIMPYNMTPHHRISASHGNILGLSNPYEYVGEAYADWKTRGLSYEYVQAILVDTRSLMREYIGNTKPQIKAMADKILAAYEYHRRITAVATTEDAANAPLPREILTAVADEPTAYTLDTGTAAPDGGH